jgi:hypothetical protein
MEKQHVLEAVVIQWVELVVRMGKRVALLLSLTAIRITTIVIQVQLFLYSR